MRLIGSGCLFSMFFGGNSPLALRRPIKSEEVYLHADQNAPEARAAIGKYLTFYNIKSPHSSLDRQTPDQAHFNPLQPIPVAA